MVGNRGTFGSRGMWLGIGQYFNFLGGTFGSRGMWLVLGYIPLAREVCGLEQGSGGRMDQNRCNLLHSDFAI